MLADVRAAEPQLVTKISESGLLGEVSKARLAELIAQSVGTAQ